MKNNHKKINRLGKTERHIVCLCCPDCHTEFECKPNKYINNLTINNNA